MISIIVPVYKTEKFLRQCLDSILQQTFNDWEMWIDDDGNMYIIYSDEDLMKEMHCKSCTVDKLKNELVEFDLLSMERHSNHLYPLHVSDSYSH